MPAVEREPAERACDACGYVVIEFRPLGHCPMCGSAVTEPVLAAAVVSASAA